MMLRNREIVLISLSALIVGSCGVKLPAAFERCKVSPELDNKPNECLRQAIQNSIAVITPGIKQLGLLPFDPLKILGMKIEQGGSSPVAIKLEFTDCDLAGAGNIKILEVNGKLSSPDDFHMQLLNVIPTIEITGPYSISGRVLILPIEGVGQTNISLFNAKYQVDITAEKQIKNEEEYLKVKSLALKISDPESMHLHFSNLFKGDKALGDNTNRFINENWKDIFVELSKSVEVAFSEVFEAYCKRILERIRFKDIFITD